MEAYIEALVGTYLTRGGKVFISPQFHVAWDKELEEGGTLPDIVALDFEKRHVVIVEVTTSSSLKKLAAWVPQRQKHWYDPVRRHLLALEAITSKWEFRTLCFIRRDRIDNAKSSFSGDDVTFQPLEEALLEYAYSSERAKGLP